MLEWLLGRKPTTFAGFIDRVLKELPHDGREIEPSSKWTKDKNAKENVCGYKKSCPKMKSPWQIWPVLLE